MRECVGLDECFCIQYAYKLQHILSAVVGHPRMCWFGCLCLYAVPILIENNLVRSRRASEDVLVGMSVLVRSTAIH